MIDGRPSGRPLRISADAFRSDCRPVWRCPASRLAVLCRAARRQSAVLFQPAYPLQRRLWPWLAAGLRPTGATDRWPHLSPSVPISGRMPGRISRDPREVWRSPDIALAVTGMKVSVRPALAVVKGRERVLLDETDCHIFPGYKGCWVLMSHPRPSSFARIEMILHV